MKAVIIDYGSGNLRSAAKAFERVAADEGLSVAVEVSADARALDDASHIVLPGQGAFGDCAAGLRAVPGMVEALQKSVIEARRPFFGICVGMQLMATRGLEHGTHDGLDWIPGEVVAMTPSDSALKIPHMGWNELELRAPDHRVLEGLASGDHAYFVHAYAFRCADAAHLLATADYGGPVAAVVGLDNMVGAQFHPEKSQAAGLRMIANFLRWAP